MAGGADPPQAEGMTSTTPRRRASTLLAVRSLAVASVLTIALTGCVAGGGVSTDDIIPDVVDQGDTGGDAGGSNDGEVTVVGADLVSSFAAIAAETYAEGRDPMPAVEFTSASAVTFTFPGTLDEAARIGNCQIAYGVLDAEGITITIVDDSGTLDCTALIEG